MRSHSITMLGTGLIGDFYTRTLHMQSDSYEVVMAGSVFKGSSPVLIDSLRTVVHRESPRATLVILMGTAASFGLPEWPILAILGIDELMDMARTSVNVIGNCLATVVIARWEGELPAGAAEKAA